MVNGLGLAYMLTFCWVASSDGVLLGSSDGVLRWHPQMGVLLGSLMASSDGLFLIASSEGVFNGVLWMSSEWCMVYCRPRIGILASVFRLNGLLRLANLYLFSDTSLWHLCSETGLLGLANWYLFSDTGLLGLASMF